MKILRSKKFTKQFKALSTTIQKQAFERLILLSMNELDPLLNNHALKGKRTDFRSINVNGDYRIIYERTSTDVAYLRFIGTHHQLYGT